MAQTKEDRVYLAYRVFKTYYVRQASETPRAHAILAVCDKFNMSIDDVKNIVNHYISVDRRT
jgi:hypothetical protein